LIYLSKCIRAVVREGGKCKFKEGYVEINCKNWKRIFISDEIPASLLLKLQRQTTITSKIAVICNPRITSLGHLIHPDPFR
jgi:hypothetical protein